MCNILPSKNISKISKEVPHQISFELKYSFPTFIIVTFRVHAIQGVGEKDFIDLGGEIEIALYSVSNFLRVNSTILY